MRQLDVPCLEGETGENPKVGKEVSWKRHGGEAHGKGVKKVTIPTHIKGHKVAAFADAPQLIVETQAGGRAAYKAQALAKIKDTDLRQSMQ